MPTHELTTLVPAAEVSWPKDPVERVVDRHVEDAPAILARVALAVPATPPVLSSRAEKASTT